MNEITALKIGVFGRCGNNREFVDTVFELLGEKKKSFLNAEIGYYNKKREKK